MNIRRALTIKFGGFLVAVVASIMVPCGSAQAADTLEDSSLKFIPADVSFYSTMMRNREQFEALTGSKAFAQLKQLPTLQMALGMARLQWENPQQDIVIAFKNFWDAAENQELLELLMDAISSEIFVCADEGAAAGLELANRINGINRAAQLEALAGKGNQKEIMVSKLIVALNEELSDFSVPNMVVGFKISDKQKANDQISRLETHLQQAIEQNAPDLKDRLKRQTIHDSEFLTLELDGSLIPWEMVPEDQLGNDPEKAKQLIEKIKEATVIISLGVYDDYLVMAVGEDTEFLAALGGGELLVNADELEPVRDAADERIVSVSYVSAELMARLGTSKGQIDDLEGLVQGALPYAPIEESVKIELLADIHSLADKIKENIPEQGAMSSFSYLTDAGYEGYSHSWAETTRVDGSQPLSILSHVGGSPISFIAARGVSDPDLYNTFVEVLKRAFYYTEKIGSGHLNDEQRATFEKVRDAVMPSVARLDEITRESIIPAFEDGQIAFVFDAKSTSMQWHQQMPQSPNPLPMLEPALVLGVTDAGLVRRGFNDYFTTIQQLLDKLHEAEPNTIPKIQLPMPKNREFGSGAVYYFPLPEEAGLDNQIAPAAGLSDSIAVLSPFPLQVKRILDTTALSAASEPLSEPNKPMAAASMFDFAGLIDAISPWVEYGFMVAEQQQSQENVMMKGIQSQVGTILTVMRCLGNATTATFVEDDVVITHFEWRIRDVD